MILSGNEILNKILISIKGHNSVTIVRKKMCNNANLDLANINAYTKFGKILSICCKNIERKGNYGRQNDGGIDEWNDWKIQIQYSHTFSKQGYNDIKPTRCNLGYKTRDNVQKM